MVSTRDHEADMAETWADDLALPRATGTFEIIDGVECYVISDVDEMEPFLTTVVSDADLWMFVSSAGSLTAGRVDADHAFFPYVTDDQIHRGTGLVGPVTAVERFVDGRREVWRPFHVDKTVGCRRSLAKSVLGDRLVFDEVHPGWQLRFRATWAPSRTYGWVRTIELLDESGSGCDVTVIDGVLDVMPSGVDSGTEQARSNLVDAFKRAERVDERLAVYNLESLITDMAEPGEALTATTVWSWGFPGAVVDLDGRAVRRFLDDQPSVPSSMVTGRPGAYLLRGPVSLEPGGSATWSFVLDTGLDHPAVSFVAREAGASDSVDRVLSDLDAGTERLHRLLESADGTQRTGDRMADVHHLSNVLFNSMRGGVFPYEQRIPTRDFAQFLEQRNVLVFQRHAPWLDHLDPWYEAAELRSMAEDLADPDLLRLLLEYLPLTFSRRHGDPSRPWNRFAIHVTNDDGSEILRYEGNWRDIFQNWEALLHSYPAYFAHVVSKFVNASTLDGYNPYRISREGVDWEVPDPHDPWANIGYWGDHQIVYLLRLLEGWERYEPGAITSWFDRPVFVYADVPYRISDRAQMIRDPRNTITFLHDREAAVAERVAKVGSDGRLVVDVSGDVFRVGLAEKLLVPALAKMSNFIPGAGIWMNTQRPEWNDANNALAGPGVSMVTVFHLHRYLVVLRDLLDGTTSVRLSHSVADWLRELADVYRTHRGAGDTPAGRRDMIEALGVVADAQGRRLLAGVRSDLVEVALDEVSDFLDHALDELARSIAGARRSDGLVDSYNLISFPDDDTAHVERLGPMLEGQVAALASGVLDADAALTTIDALYSSEMYRADLDSFMLYPVTELLPFMERNRIPDGVLPDDADARMPSAVSHDTASGLRFRPCASNEQALRELLDHDNVPEFERGAVYEAYEACFGHAGFTGRSGSMYGYEGIGSIYWHMVSKLLLATQEIYWTARDEGADDATVDRLAAAYRRIRNGLGFTKTPDVFGAFPVDCYSHSPAHSGAQQPGMTGQVKEEVLTRLGELGVRIRGGVISLQPELLDAGELLADGSAGAFTLCGVPMVLQVTDEPRVTVVHADGTTREHAGSAMSRDDSAKVFARSGEVLRIEWGIGRGS